LAIFRFMLNNNGRDTVTPIYLYLFMVFRPTICQQ
jgi:hypothetical protein